MEAPEATATQEKKPRLRLAPRTPRTPPDSWVQTRVVALPDGNGKPGTLLSSMLGEALSKLVGNQAGFPRLLDCDLPHL